jgi:flagellar biosynthesis protein FliP
VYFKRFIRIASRWKIWLLALLLMQSLAFAVDNTTSSQVNLAIKSSSLFDQSSLLNLKNQLRIIGFLTLISLIPFGVMMMTSFLRVSIVFQFLRQALGSSQVPSNQIIIGLSLILTGFIMQPVIHQIQINAIQPYMNGDFVHVAANQNGTQTEETILIEKIWYPLKRFLSNHIREKDLQLFLEVSHTRLQKTDNSDMAGEQENDEDDMLQTAPWYCIIPAFMLSELRTAFMMGFLLFLPFLIIDMVVAAVLMSMGMMMLPPIMVSTPFKILLFIMIDGWHLIVQQIINGFHTIN